MTFVKVRLCHVRAVSMSVQPGMTAIRHQVFGDFSASLGASIRFTWTPNTLLYERSLLGFLHLRP